MRTSRWVVRGAMLFVCGAVITLSSLIASPAPTVVRADETTDASVTELAQRYLQQNGGTSTKPDLLPGQTPPDLPITPPLPTGSRLIGTVVTHSTTNQTTWTVLFDAPGTPAENVAFVEGALQSSGWATPMPYDYLANYVPSGFQDHSASSTTPTPFATRTPGPSATVFRALCMPAMGTMNKGVNVNARPMPNNMTGVSLAISTTSSYCASRFTTPSATPRTRPLPVLNGPSGSAVSTIDYDELGDNISDATIVSDLSAAEIETFYAGQLEDAGWTRLSGDVRGPLAWSLWSTPNGKQGYLSVLEIAGEGIRDLHLQINSLSSNNALRSQPVNWSLQHTPAR